jgi:hypothetical protein
MGGDRGKQDFEALRLRYNAAFDAYHTISTANARRSVTGDSPPVEDLILERRALEELAAARRDLLAALDSPTSAA